MGGGRGGDLGYGEGAAASCVKFMAITCVALLRVLGAVWEGVGGAVCVGWGWLAPGPELLSEPPLPSQQLLLRFEGQPVLVLAC